MQLLLQQLVIYLSFYFLGLFSLARSSIRSFVRSFVRQLAGQRSCKTCTFCDKKQAVSKQVAGRDEMAPNQPLNWSNFKPEFAQRGNSQFTIPLLGKLSRLYLKVSKQLNSLILTLVELVACA